MLPIGAIKEKADEIKNNLLGGIEGIAMGKFDYGGDYSMQDASNWGKERGSKIGNMFSPLGGLIGGLIGEKIAEKRAKVVLENRTEKMNQLLEQQRQKIQSANLFKATEDLNIEI